jgi:hemoglobin-like flavoprotein
MHIEILRTSFESLDHGDWNFTRRFYEILLARHPELRAMFGVEVQQKQHAMLYQALAAIMDHLDNAYWLKSALAKYGVRHLEYGVTEEMYGWFGESLLATLAEAKGKEWTPELEQAWREAYDAIRNLMNFAGPRALG